MEHSEKEKVRSSLCKVVAMLWLCLHFCEMKKWGVWVELHGKALLCLEDTSGPNTKIFAQSLLEASVVAVISSSFPRSPL